MSRPVDDECRLWQQSRRPTKIHGNKANSIRLFTLILSANLHGNGCGTMQPEPISAWPCHPTTCDGSHRPEVIPTISQGPTSFSELMSMLWQDDLCPTSYHLIPPSLNVAVPVYMLPLSALSRCPQTSSSVSMSRNGLSRRYIS